MRKQKILLFGATGMAGHMAYYYLSETGIYDVVNVVYRTPLTSDSIVVDVNDRHEVEIVIREVSPDIILNCIGVLIKGSHEHPDNAIYVNGYFPHLLKRLADEADAKLIHISTDCVFSGRQGNYSEDDFRDADDIYGRSKALGEIVNEKDLTLRTSIIGPELKANGEGLFHWFMSQRDTINGFKTAIWGGVTTLELAKVIDYAIKNELTGLIHVSNGEGVCKYDLLHLFKRIWEKNLTIVPVDANGINKSIAGSDRMDYEVPSYESMLLELKEWMDRYPHLYNQYIG